jgi:CHAD domain-containing protein
VTTRSPAGDVITGYLRTQVRALLSEDVRFRVGGDDSIHQLRVGTRRLRTALRVFGPFIEEEWASPLHEGLGWLAATLGTARDAEVVLARLSSAVDALPEEKVLGPVQARLEQHIGGTLAKAVAELETVMEGDRYLSLLESLVDAAWRPRTTARAEEPAKAALPDVVKAAWRKLGTGVARVQESDDEGDYHKVRIAAKRLRYTAEALLPAFGRPAQRLAQQVERVQDVLGEYVDAVAAQRALREVARSSTGRPVGFTLGLLHAAEEQRAAVARIDFAMLWPEVARRRYRDWLTA